MSSSDSPCAACKFLKRKCTRDRDCILAPYFPSDEPEKFATVHKVFGASNVAKLLHELSMAQREHAVESLVCEAEARLRDPVYGCVGLVFALQQQLRRVKSDLFHAKSELTTYIGSKAMLPMIQPTHAFMPQQHLSNPSSPNNLMNVPQQQHQTYEAQQMEAVIAARKQEMLRAYVAQQRHQPQHHQQHQELIGFNHSGFEGAAGCFNQVNDAAMSPSLALGTFDNQCQIQSQQQEQEHHPLLFRALRPPQTQPQQTLTLLPPQHQRSGSEEGRSGGLP